MVFEFYNAELNKTVDIAKAIEVINPLDYDISNSHQYYTYKIKRFLTDIALGMMPSKVWAGKYDTTGGFLVVKESGEILCYHVYNKNDFENYLLHNTKLETASSSRHDFGKVFREANGLYFKLNLQIRFIK
jgi:type II restriction enzyme